MQLGGKSAIVVGAGGGIGRAVAERFVVEGARVFGVDLSEEGMGRTAAAVGATSGGFTYRCADVSDSTEVRSALAAAARELGRIDTLVNAHGISLVDDGPIILAGDDVFDRTVAVNLRGVFLTCKYSIPYIKSAGGGAIVNISSIGALVGFGGTSYTASKGGVNALSRAIAFQHASDLIRCNTICPGPVSTPMLETSLEKLGIDTFPTPPGVIPRIVNPSEVAALVAFLASDDAASITGAAYTIDGGMTLH